MTFLERLQTHKGGLLRLKTELYWYGSQGYDESPDRICLILDAARRTAAPLVAARTATAARRTAAAVRSSTAAARIAALLLIDGSPQWVWMDEADIEILVNNQPIK